MTKKDLNIAVLGLCEKHGASDELTEALNQLTQPKSGGKSDVNDYTCFDADGNVTHIFCTVYKQWLPVEHFKEGKTPNGFNRYSIEGDQDWKARAKAYKDGKAAVIADLLEGEISNDAAKSAIADLEVARQDVGEAPEEAVAEKPCGE